MNVHQKWWYRLLHSSLYIFFVVIRIITFNWKARAIRDRFVQFQMCFSFILSFIPRWLYECGGNFIWSFLFVFCCFYRRLLFLFPFVSFLSASFICFSNTFQTHAHPHFHIRNIFFCAVTRNICVSQLLLAINIWAAIQPSTFNKTRR